MDYNNNDFEGQNIHIVGEDSSKVSSILRPYALPKLYFDDSLHGQLRFDILVENEGFLGITSQEDNHWIDDFSRAGNQIDFCSSAAESCSLPTHINVWSEATSSESVEMLLKSVVLEETAPCEILMRESNPLIEQGTSSNGMDNSLMKDDINTDSNNRSSSFPPINAEWTVSRPILNTENVCMFAEDTSEAQALMLSSCEELGGVKDSDLVLIDNPSFEMKKKDDLGEACAMENESGSNQVNANFSTHGSLIDKREYHSQTIVPVLGVEIGSTERNCSIIFSSNANSSEEEHGLEIPVFVLKEASSSNRNGVTVSINEMSVGSAIDAEHASSASYGTMGLASDTGSKQVSDTPSLYYENSSITVSEEDKEGVDTKSSCSGSVTTCADIELVHAPIVKLLSEEMSCCPDVDILHASNSSFEVQNLSFMTSGLSEVIADKIDYPEDIKEVDGHINSKYPTIVGECFRKKSIMGVDQDLRDSNVMPESAVGHSYDVNILVDGSRQPYAEGIHSRLLDECHHGSDVPESNREDTNLVLDPFDAVKKDVEASSPINNMKDETAITSHSDASKGYSDMLNLSQVLDPEIDEKSLVSSAEATESHDVTDAKQSCKTENKGLGEQTLSENTKQTSDSVSVECLRSDELTSYCESEEVPKHDSVVGETRNNEINYSETSNFSLPNKGCNDLNKKQELSDSGSVALHKCIGTEIEKNLNKVAHSGMGEYSTIEAAAPDPGFDNFKLLEVDKTTSLQGNDVVIDEVLLNAEPSVVDIPVEEGRACTINTWHSMPQSASDSGKDVHFPRIQACKISSTGKQASCREKADDLKSNVVPNISSPTSALGSSSEDLRSPSNRTSRRGGSKSVKGSAKKANQVKETISLRQNEKGDESLQFVSPLGSGQLMNFDSCGKPRGPLLVPASGLPDLNTSAPPSAFFRLPFTDLQQVQLRAQIIVYGSLIQGAAPDEACMISAFDGNRNLWEPSWRACLNRLQVGKSTGIIDVAFIPAPQDAQVPNQSRRLGFSEGEVVSSVAAHARNKGVASPAFNPVVPLSSPLWTMTTVSGCSHPTIIADKNAVVDYQIFSSLNHYQTPDMRKYATQSSWSPLATLPYLVPTQSSPFDFRPHHSAFPITAPVKLSPIRDSSMHIGLGSKHFAPIPTTSVGVPTELFAGPSDLKNLKFPAEKNSDQTARKRKKPSDPDDSLLVSVTTPLVDTNPTAVGHQSTKKTLEVEDSGQIPFVPQTQVHSRHTMSIGSHYSTSVTVPNPSLYMPKRLTSQFLSFSQPFISGDTLKRVELGIDNRALNIEGLSNAEKAKQQAEEASANAATAIAYCETVWSQLGQQYTSHLTLDSDSKLASAAAAIAAAASVAKAAAISAMIAANVAAQEKHMFEEALIMCRTAKTTEFDTSLASCPINTMTNTSSASILSGLNKHSTSAIAAAREAARKRVEAASAVTRHAENLDAIVKAAELAAEAVSHAGKIVAMTEPLSLSKLVESGPNKYWKDLQLKPLPGLNPNDKGGDSCIHRDTEVMLKFRNHHGVPDACGASSIKEGSHVEVLRACGDLKKAWFSATVLHLREDEALVCYSDILSGEGSEQLKEWVSKEAKDNTAPRVRNPHSLYSVPYGKTGKRPRDASRDFIWSIGDKVDVWMQNCWFEGIISENKKKDESVLGVKFPDQEETVVVKVWHLRPTFIWNGVEWVEASRSGSYKGDTPALKKPKIASTVNEITEKGKQLENDDSAEIPTTKEAALPLSANEKKFCIGSKVEGNKHKVTRGARVGLEKEGSRVVFGIPKPGKKRKFMEVSKHYVSEQRGKSNVHSDSVRLAKLLTQHGPSSRSSKNSKKVETKEKQAYGSKPIGLRSARQASNLKKDESASSKPDGLDEFPRDHVGKGSTCGNESEVGVGEAKQEENSGDAMIFSSEAILPQLNRKMVPRNEHVVRRKIPIPSGRSLRSETLISETVEPRRSVRRIQPTSRLLEGLQSSLILSKLQSTSHEKDKARGGSGSGSSSRGE